METVSRVPATSVPHEHLMERDRYRCWCHSWVEHVVPAQKVSVCIVVVLQYLQKNTRGRPVDHATGAKPLLRRLLAHEEVGLPRASVAGAGRLVIEVVARDGAAPASRAARSPQDEPRRKQASWGAPGWTYCAVKVRVCVCVCVCGGLTCRSKSGMACQTGSMRRGSQSCS